MKINNAKFELTAVKKEQYPHNNLTEVALVGRSNVGKSSLINYLLNRKNLARVAKTPGKTREINFYNVDEKFLLVDLPGYGFASVSKEKQSSWGSMIESYLNNRAQLKLIVQLIDVRHTPSNDDKLMYSWIRQKNIPHVIVATKIDKITRAKYKERLTDIKNTLQLLDGVSIINFSSFSKQGKEELLEEISKIFEG